MPRFPAALCALALSACHFSLHDHIEVDGVRLDSHHEEVLTLDAWPANGLVIEAHRGNVRVEHAEGPTTLTVLVHERRPGEAHARLEEGRLVARAEGQPAAIGDVIVRTSGPARGLKLSTGMGDVELKEVAVEGELELTTGMGDVDVVAAGTPAGVVLSTGMGDVGASKLHCARFSAETGMGDVHVLELEAEAAKLRSGMGDVEVGRSKGGRLVASSGMGDVDVVESSFTTHDLDTGLGRVRER